MGIGCAVARSISADPNGPAGYGDTLREARLDLQKQSRSGSDGKLCAQIAPVPKSLRLGSRRGLAFTPLQRRNKQGPPAQGGEPSVCVISPSEFGIADPHKQKRLAAYRVACP